MRCSVVVVAGGAGRRFGGDKLAAALEPGPAGRSLVAATVDGVLGLAPSVPVVLPVVVVGPARPDLTGDPRVLFVREQPPGGGPAAGAVAGARAAADADVLVVLPGDAPFSPEAVPGLVAALHLTPAAQAAVAVDPGGRRQHLMLAVRRPAATAWGRGAAGRSARSLLDGLEVVEVPVSARECMDVDDTAALERARAAARSAGGGCAPVLSPGGRPSSQGSTEP